MWESYTCARTIDEAVDSLAKHGSSARLIAGGTDLMLELERGLRKDIEHIVDISRIAEIATIYEHEGVIHIGAGVTHNQIIKSDIIRTKGLPLALACFEVGSPQIRNRGTVVGNLVTGSPANDTITPLIALGGSLKLKSVKGERVIQLNDFYTGVRKTILEPGEMVVEVIFPGMGTNVIGTFIKNALRRAQAISVVNAAVIIEMEGRRINSSVVTLGSVAPTIIHAEKAEAYLAGKELSDDVIETAAQIAAEEAAPISDIRGSSDYRSYLVEISIKQALEQLRAGQQFARLPESIITLGGCATPCATDLVDEFEKDEITTTVNGKQYVIRGASHKSLLHMLRDDLGLTGTKEGCGEGECGACTLFLDGKAVMGCLVPAPRAHGAIIETIEGIAQNGELHPVQQAFIDQGAVQCGYCTPGFVMSAVKLLEEVQRPTQEQIKQGLTGNLCRCTGYYTIVKAVEQAAASLAEE